MTSSQTNKPSREERVTVTLSLRRSVLRKLNRRAKQESSDDAMANRSRVADRVLDDGLK